MVLKNHLVEYFYAEYKWIADMLDVGVLKQEWYVSNLLQTID